MVPRDGLAGSWVKGGPRSGQHHNIHDTLDTRLHAQLWLGVSSPALGTSALGTRPSRRGGGRGALLERLPSPPVMEGVVGHCGGKEGEMGKGQDECLVPSSPVPSALRRNLHELLPLLHSLVPLIWLWAQESRKQLSKSFFVKYFLSNWPHCSCCQEATVLGSAWPRLGPALYCNIFLYQHGLEHVPCP